MVGEWMACWQTQQPAQSRGLGRSTATPDSQALGQLACTWRAQTRRVAPCAAVVGCWKRPTPRDCAGCRVCQQAEHRPLSSVLRQPSVLRRGVSASDPLEPGRLGEPTMARRSSLGLTERLLADPAARAVPGLGRSTAAPGLTSTWATRLTWLAQTRRVAPCTAVVGCSKRPTPRDCAGCRVCQQAEHRPLSTFSADPRCCDSAASTGGPLEPGRLGRTAATAPPARRGRV